MAGNNDLAIRLSIAAKATGEGVIGQISEAVSATARALREAKGELPAYNAQLKAAAKTEAELAKVLRDIQTPQELHAKNIASTTKLFQEGRLTLEQYHRAIENYDKRLSSATSTQDRFSASIGKAVAAFLAFSSVKSVVGSLVDVATRFDRISSVLQIASGSAVSAARDLDFLRITADKLGLDLSSSADAYAKFTVATKGTVLEGDKTRQIFESTANALARIGATSEQTERALKALTDMVSKGTVQAEELKGQLGDVLPGAMNMAASASKKTTQEFLKLADSGGVLAVDLLPKLANEFDKTFGTSRVETLQSNLSRLNTEWEQFKLALSSPDFFNEVAIGLGGILRTSTDVSISNQELAGKTLEQLQAIHDARVRLLAQEEELGIRSQYYKTKLQEVNAELAKFNAESVKNISSGSAAGLTALGGKAGELVKQFEQLTKGGKSTAEALAQIGKGLNQNDIGGITAYGRALDSLRQTGKITGEEIRNGLVKVLSGFGDSQLKSFAVVLEGMKALQTQSGASRDEVRALAELIDGVLRESLQRFGVDADQALTGISKPVQDSITRLDGLSTALKAAGTTAKETGEVLAKALTATTAQAQTRKEIEAIRSAITALGEAGKISARQQAEAEAELAGQLRTVHQQEVENNAVLQEAIAAQAKAVDTAERHTAAVEREATAKQAAAQLAYDSAKASGNEAKAAEALIELKQTEAHQSDLVAAAKQTEAKAAQDKLLAITAEAQADGEVTDAERKVVDAAKEVVAAKTAEAQAAKDSAESKDIEVTAAKKEAQASKDSVDAQSKAADAVQNVTTLVIGGGQAMERYNAIVNAGSDAWTQFNAVIKLSQDYLSQTEAYDRLIAKFEEANSSGEGLVEALRSVGAETAALGDIADSTRAKFNLLDQSKLDTINSAIQTAQQNLVRMRDSASSLVDSLTSEAAGAAGTPEAQAAQSAISARQTLEQRKKEIQAALDEARKAGDTQTQSDLRKALQLAEQIYQDTIKKAGDDYAADVKSANEKAGKSIREAARDAADAIKTATEDLARTIAEIKAASRDYGAGIDDQIRAIQQGTMTDVEARADRILELEEKIKAANAAIKSGDLEHAQALRDEVQQISQGLAEAGGGVDKNQAAQQAIQGLEAAKKIDESLAKSRIAQAQAETAAKIADIKTEEDAKIASIKFTKKAELDAAKSVHDAIMAYIAEEGQARTQTVKNSATAAGIGVKASTGGLLSDGSIIPTSSDTLSKSGPGSRPIGLATGGEVFSGHFPGYGGGDRRHVIAEDGEYMHRKEAVAHYGVDFMHAINAMKFSPQKLALGGLITLPSQNFASGSPVGSGQEITINLSSGGQRASGRFSDDAVTAAVVRSIKRGQARR